MSGVLIAAVAALLTPQAAPHPSTLEPYSAPAIRPFEPDDDFGREIAEGDSAHPAHRPPIAGPVTVDAYDGSYEATPTDLEIAYSQGVRSAEIRADQTAGPLDGAWRVSDAGGRTLYELVLMDRGAGRVEGGWRDGGDFGGAVAEGRALILEDGGGRIVLEPTGDGWRGRLTIDGQILPVTLTRPD
ncbi:MAG: hypothetical protein IR159_09380 [Brevundimonas sp.]|nr:hypothetical protein [Brevundimonas sp.]